MSEHSTEKPTDGLLLVDDHRPTLTAGTYEVSMQHTVAGVGGPSRTGFEEPYESTARFHVLAPRTSIDPGWVSERFPPSHSTGDHADVLPHLTLARSTLPWERTAQHGVTAEGGAAEALPPWVAVLLLTDDEISGAGSLPPCRLHEVVAASLVAPSSAGSPVFPGLDPEPGGPGPVPVRVLDLPLAHVEAYLPEGGWLASLTHVREHGLGAVEASDVDRNELDAGRLPHAVAARLRALGCPLGPQVQVGVDDQGTRWEVTDRDSGRTVHLEHDGSGADIEVTDEERAVVVSCRSTRPGTSYRAFLVSLDGRYRPGQDGVLSFDSATATEPQELVRLVVLDTWTFAVDAAAGHLEHLLVELFGEATTADGEARDLTLTVPSDTMSGPGVAALRAGYALLPHDLRQGGRTRSWYRGPLMPRWPSHPPAPPSVPTLHSDDLLVLDQRHQMFDVSAAAAFELGRSLVLANREVALDLAGWKQTNRRASHRSRVSAKHLPLGANDDLEASHAVPSAVGDLVERLVHLDGIPFSYLVPDPAMLPPESARVFVVDHQWLYHLLDGVVSIGRLHDRHAEHETAAWWALRDRAFRALLASPAREEHPRQVSGVLMRSEVVAGWPDLHVEAHHPGTQALLHPIRRTRLSDNVLLVLLDGPVGTLVVHPNLQALHHARPEQRTPTGTGVDGRDEVVDVGRLTNAPLSPSGVARALLSEGPRVEVSFA